MIGLVSGELVRRLADSLVLPFNCKRYAKVLQSEYKTFKSNNGLQLEKLNVSLNHLEAALNQFEQVSHKFNARLNSVDRSKLVDHKN